GHGGGRRLVQGEADRRGRRRRQPRDLGPDPERSSQGAAPAKARLPRPALYARAATRRAGQSRRGDPKAPAQPDCAVGLTRISLTSTWAGCETAYITARATSAGSRAFETGLSKNGVSTIPGSIRVTRTPLPSSSSRADSPIAVTAHLVAEYKDPGSARRPATEPVSNR